MRHTYLGHKIYIAGEWKEQVNIILSEFTSKLATDYEAATEICH